MGVAFTSCMNEEFIGDNSPMTSQETPGAISFAFDVPQATRADGAAAADKLNNQFIVWGEKNETAAAPAAGNLVFPNYKVTYGTNTAYTTTSNTKDWEYVGLSWTADEAENVKMGGTAVTENDQTIKYWDYAASSYTFTAVSAKPEDITNGRVVINKLTSDDDSKYEKGYTITLAKTGTAPDFVYPSLADLYFSDRNEITQGSGKDRTAPNAYGGNVQLTFRNALSQVRVGVYETIPGYAVTEIKFYVTGDAEATDGATPTPTSAFGAICPNVKADNFTGTINVTYYDGTVGSLNTPKLTITPDAGLSKNDLILGTNMSMLSTTKTLGTTSTSPTWDQVDGSGNGLFTSVLPQIANTTNLKLKVDYTLWNSVTGETINITGKTAEVPAQYLQWKPNFKYTYLFKISDNDLYPITFDAVTIEADDGNVEYITTVSEPSITTYAKGSKVTVNNEYDAGEKVYAVVEDGSSLATLSATNMKLYEVTTTDATNFPITEASVAEAIAEYPIMTATEQTNAKIKFTANSFNYGKTIIAEDGSTVEMDATNNVVADFTTAANKTYAIEYMKTAATYGNDGGKTYADATAFAAAGTLYTDAACTTEATSWTDGTTYYKKTHVTNVGKYAYKIVKVKVTP